MDALQIGRAVLERLALQAAANRAAGDQLRAELRAVLERYPGRRLTAKQVLRCLARRPLPSVRRVQELLKEIRAERRPRQLSPLHKPGAPR